MSQKRRKREYRQAQKARWTRPEPGFSLYEGRTRGKRARYTFSDNEEDFYSDARELRRSGRNAALAQANADYSESDAAPNVNGRPTRNSRRFMESWADTRDAIDSEDGGDMKEGDDDMSSNHSDEWQGEDEMDGNEEEAESEPESGSISDLNESPKSHMVKLSFKNSTSKDRLRQIEVSPAEGDSTKEVALKEERPNNHTDPVDNADDRAAFLKEPNETKPSSPDASSRPNFSKFLYTPPSQDTEPHHRTGPGATQPSPSILSHHKMNGMSILPQHTPPASAHFQNGAARIPTPPETGPQNPEGLR